VTSSRDDRGARFAAAVADRYTVERELGLGGPATDYLALDLKHERRVALKMFNPELSAAVGGRRFLSEIRLLARLHHPYILPLYDSGEAAGMLYYAMPYVEGESLRDRLEREPQLPVADALRITRQVAEALAYAHAENIVHRDIKPENILLAPTHAAVADFGVARAISRATGERSTAAGVVLGTPAYMSPEQASGDQVIDGRSDIYALGCVLYEMLAGGPPFTGPTPQAVIARRFVGTPPRLRAVRPVVPGRVESVVSKSLALLPAERFATAGELAAAIQAAESKATPWWRWWRGGVAALAAFLGVGR